MCDLKIHTKKKQTLVSQFLKEIPNLNNLQRTLQQSQRIQLSNDLYNTPPNWIHKHRVNGVQDTTTSLTV